MTPADLIQLRLALGDVLKGIQGDCDVTGLDVLAARLQETGIAPLPFHGRLILKELEQIPRNYSALIWHLVQVLAKMDG